MYTYSYGSSIVKTVELTVETLGYDMEDYDWSPSLYYLALFVLGSVLAPLFLIVILTQDKWETVKTSAYVILDRHFFEENEK